MQKTIVLPAGTTEISVSKIPFEIANAITPVGQAAIVRIASVYKVFPPIDQNEEELEEALTDFDWCLLDEIFKAAKLPQFRPVYGKNGMDWTEWAKYKNAIAEYKKILGMKIWERKSWHARSRF